MAQFVVVFPTECMGVALTHCKCRVVAHGTSDSVRRSVKFVVRLRHGFRASEGSNRQLLVGVKPKKDCTRGLSPVASAAYYHV